MGSWVPVFGITSLFVVSKRGPQESISDAMGPRVPYSGWHTHTAVYVKEVE